MGKIIEEIRPEAIMMENVPGLAMRGKVIFDRFLHILGLAGYCYNWRVEQMANFGVPQSRRRLVLLAGLGFEIPFPDPTHARNPAPDSGLHSWVTVRSAIGHLKPPMTLSEAIKRGGPQAHNWHVVSDLKSITRKRLKAAMPGRSWRIVNESLRPWCHRNGYEGFPNVYGRMSWDDVAPTITTGCTTPCRGRFGHPDRRRYTISVREAGLLQTFPYNYRFRTDQMNAVCSMIGNAVPPIYAELAGRVILSAIKKREIS
jgi:DNA (cytosine-5)-methyltransferase 1